jgi:DNA topoisomerase-1
MKILVIVESPNKIKKIQTILNERKDGNQYVVKATVGHILDLDKEKGGIGIDIDNDFTPKYTKIKSKTSVINDLKKTSKQCQETWIASDLDQEGEFIGYSICIILSLPMQLTKRLIFNEITKSAINHAVDNPVQLDQSLLNSQKCRRILDRLIGFQLSKVARQINNNISVGRVKTVMVKFVSDREKIRSDFEEECFFKLSGIFECSQLSLEAKCSTMFKSSPDVENYLKDVEDVTTITNIKETTLSEKPPEPFKTSTLQQEGAKRFGLTPKHVLGIAQKLYEQGLISYPRTDTTRLPEEKKAEIKSLIIDKYGIEYLSTEPSSKKDKKSGKNTQGAHAGIFPTNLKNLSVDDELQNKIYRMIYNRAVASMMKPAQYHQVVSEFEYNKCKWVSTSKSLIFLGYLIVYGQKLDIQPDKDSKKIKVGDEISITKIEGVQNWTRPKPLYDNSSLLSEMEKHGIGRPSTWGQILDDVISKGFIIRRDLHQPSSREQTKYIYSKQEITKNIEIYSPSPEKNKLIMSELGNAVVGFSQKYFDNLFNHEFTGELEKQLNSIEKDKCNWVDVIQGVYDSYLPNMNKLLSDSSLTNNLKPKFFTPILLGEFESNDRIYLKKSKFGYFLFSETNGNFPLKSEHFEPSLDDLNQAPDYVDSIDIDVIKKYITQPKEKKDTIKLGKYQILYGPYGPFVKYGKTNVKIPDSFHDKLESVTIEQCEQWFSEKPKFTKRRKK